MDQGTKNIMGIIWRVVFVIVAIIGAGMWGCPQYNVWEQGLTGEAALARATQDRQIRIQESIALKESAQNVADSEIIRAGGVAEANKIIAEGLGGPEGYLRWRYIEMLQETGGQGRETIYIPTEAGIPILEAGKLKP